MQNISTNDTILTELNFLIALYLKQNKNFGGVANEFIRTLETNELLPKRLDWLGNSHLRRFDEIQIENPHVPPDFLVRICNQLRQLFDKQLNNKFTSINSLLGCGQYSLLQDLNQNDKKLKVADTLPKHFHVEYANTSINLIKNLTKTQLNGLNNVKHVVQPEIFKSTSIHKRILGHLSAVYCVCFDRTGRYILTGADDNLIKMWSSADGRLLATLRGHDKEISDIDINFENTLLVSGSCDKTIRIWNLKTTETTTVLQGHSAMVTSVEFSPNCRSDERWMASSGNDGAVCFWQWNVKTLAFNPKPKKFIEKSRSGAQMLCISFSSGGYYLSAGSNDHVIRVYYFEDNQPVKICELEFHKNFVDSIQYSNHSTSFLSGSKDGSALIWNYKSKAWKALQIDVSKSLHKSEIDESLENFRKYNVTMVTWNSDDSLVVTAQNNYLIKVWNSNDAQLIHELKGHTDEVFLLEAHPREPRILLSAGYDGYIMIWNLHTGKLIRKFFNKIENEGHGSVFDAKWSPLLDMFAITDSHGYLTIFGFGSDDDYKKTQVEQFFHTDYRPLMRDANDYVIDEQTGQPPHLMPPPFLVNADGNPYGIEIQRLVPGRENSTDSQLNPHIVVNERGVPEILGDMDSAEVSADDTQLRVQSRRRNLWRKNFIQPLDSVLLQTSEDYRLKKLDEEETYTYNEYTKTNSGFSKHFTDDESMPSRRGRKSKEKKPKQTTEILCKDRYQQKALYDTDDDRVNTSQNTVDVLTNSDSEDIVVDVDDRDLESEDDDEDEDDDDEDEDDEDDEDDDDDDDCDGEASRDDIRNSKRSVMATRNSTTKVNKYIYSDSDLESDESEYSDWENEAGKKKAKQSASSSTRKEKRRRKKHKVKYEDEMNVDVEATNGTVVKPMRKTRNARVIYDDDDDDDNGGNDSSVQLKNIKPSTSNRVTSPKKQARVGRKSKTPNQKQTKKRLQIEKAISGLGDNELKICPPEYKPPDWFSATKPKKSPYFPQIGDVVVYFRQGHEIYVNTVKYSSAYEIEERTLPWNKYAALDILEYCKVMAVKVEIKPPRLVCLKLNVLDKCTLESTSSKFSVKYHDMAGVTDFVILKQVFDRGMEKSWKTKDRFRCIIDDVWWFGTIESREAFDLNYSDSPFQCFNVVWDSSDTEKLSPWDLEPINMKKSKSLTKGESIPVTSEDLNQNMYTPDDDEWPSCGRDAECDRLVAGLQRIMELSIAEYFTTPVDLDKYPLYAITINYPIDLNTIKVRLENRYYRRVSSIQWDIRHIEANAKKFNEPKSEIVRKAGFITLLLNEFIGDPNCTDPIPIYKRQFGAGQILNDSNDDEHTANYDDSNHDHMAKRKPSKQTTYQRDTNAWKDACKALLERIISRADSEPFRRPVDLAEITDYTTVIAEPMDFGTIRQKLFNGLYGNVSEFNDDCKLVFANSKAYNTNKRSRIYQMTLRLSSLYESEIKKILKEYKSAMKYNLIMTTSRYGRRIKLRYGADVNEHSATEYHSYNSIAHDSDDARHGFEDSFATATSSNNNNKAATSKVHNTVQPSTSSSHHHNNNNYASASMASHNNHYATRSSARLKTSHSVTLQTRSSNSQQMATMMRRSESSALEKSYFTKDTTESESNCNNTNSDMDNEISMIDACNLSNHVANSNNNHNNNKNSNGHHAYANNINNNCEYKKTRSSSILHESYVNGTVSSQNTSNDASSRHMHTGSKTSSRGVKSETAMDTSHDNHKYHTATSQYESDHEHENKPVHKKLHGAATSTTLSRTRSSKRNRKQNKSYKEITSSSNNDDLSDSSAIVSRKTLKRKKQRRISSSFDENLNGNDSYEPNGNSNSSLNDYEVQQQAKVSTRGRPLKTVSKNN